MLTNTLLYNQQKSSWYGSIQKIIQNIPDLHNKLGSAVTKLTKYTIKKSVNNAYIHTWKNDSVKYSDGKLRSYLKFKCNFGFEEYLNIVSNFELRRSISKFRMSSHHLEIERGRYQGIPPDSRICKKCGSGEIEDKIPFLFVCSKLSVERKTLLDTIADTCSNFMNLTNEQQFIWLMSCENEKNS